MLGEKLGEGQLHFENAVITHLRKTVPHSSYASSCPNGEGKQVGQEST